MVINRAERARRDRRGGADRPFVAVHVQATTKGSQVVTVLARPVAIFDVVIVPAEHLVRLHARHKASLGEVKRDRGQETAADQVDRVVMRQVHGGPPHPQGVGHEQRLQAREHLAHKQCRQGGIGRVQRRKRAKDHRGLSEARGVQVDAEQLVDASQARRVALHRIVGGSEPVKVLVPRRRAGEQQLDRHREHADVSKRPGEERRCAGRTKDEHDQGADEGGSVVAEAVGNPGQDVKRRVLMSRQDVADIGTIEDVFQGRKHTDPDSRAPLARDEPTTIVSIEFASQTGQHFMDGLTGTRRRKTTTPQWGGRGERTVG